VEVDLEEHFAEPHSYKLGYNNVYLVLNDVIPNNVKMRRHNITSEQPFCSVCGLTDDTNHRIKLCHGARDVWNFVGDILSRKLRLEFHDPADLLSQSLNVLGELGVWLVSAAISYNVQKYRNVNLDEFKQEVRNVRWRKRHLLEKFGNSIWFF
jgi:hypothetical protein